MKPFPKSYRILAAFLLLTFTVTSAPFSYAAGEGEQRTKDKEKKLLLPSSLGTIESFVACPKSSVPCPLIFYIQDAHDSLEAQENIAKIIQHLVKHENVKTVFEEGYEGAVPTDLFFGFVKDAKIREKISYFLLDKLRLGGAEYAHINRKSDFKLIGADNLKLYKENIALYQKAAKHREKILRELNTLHAEIDRLANRFFPKNLKNWLKLKERYEGGALPLLEYLKRSMREEQSGKRFPTIQALLSDPSHPSLQSFTSEAFFSEMDSLEKGIVRAFLKNDRDFKIFQYQQNLSALKRLAELKLTQNEFQTLPKILAETKTQDLANFILRESKKSLALSKAWEMDIQNTVRFYEIATLRDAAIEKTISKAPHPTQPAILIFGGFHRQNIESILKRNRFSYSIISPKITKSDPMHQAYYQQLMTSGHHPFEKPFLPAHATRSAALLTESYARAEIRTLYDAAVRKPDIPATHLDRYLSQPVSRAETRTIPSPETAYVRALEALNPEHLKDYRILRAIAHVLEPELIYPFSFFNNLPLPAFTEALEEKLDTFTTTKIAVAPEYASARREKELSQAAVLFYYLNSLEKGQDIKDLLLFLLASPYAADYIQALHGWDGTEQYLVLEKAEGHLSLGETHRQLIKNLLSTAREALRSKKIDSIEDIALPALKRLTQLGFQEEANALLKEIASFFPTQELQSQLARSEMREDKKKEDLHQKLLRLFPIFGFKSWGALLQAMREETPENMAGKIAHSLRQKPASLSVAKEILQNYFPTSEPGKILAVESLESGPLISFSDPMYALALLLSSALTIISRRGFLGQVSSFFTSTHLLTNPASTIATEMLFQTPLNSSYKNIPLPASFLPKNWLFDPFAADQIVLNAYYKTAFKLRKEKTAIAYPSDLTDDASPEIYFLPHRWLGEAFIREMTARRSKLQPLVESEIAEGVKMIETGHSAWESFYQESKIGKFPDSFIQIHFLHDRLKERMTPLILQATTNIVREATQYLRSLRNLSPEDFDALKQKFKDDPNSFKPNPEIHRRMALNRLNQQRNQTDNEIERLKQQLAEKKSGRNFDAFSGDASELAILEGEIEKQYHIMTHLKEELTALTRSETRGLETADGARSRMLERLFTMQKDIRFEPVGNDAETIANSFQKTILNLVDTRKLNFNLHHLLNLRYDLAEIAEIPMPNEQKAMSFIRIPFRTDSKSGLTIFKWADAEDFIGYSSYSFRQEEGQKNYVTIGINVFPDFRSVIDSAAIFETLLALLNQKFSPQKFIVDGKHQIHDTVVGNPVVNAAFYLKRGFYPLETKSLADTYWRQLQDPSFLLKQSQVDTLKTSSNLWILPVMRDVLPESKIFETIEHVFKKRESTPAAPPLQDKRSETRQYQKRSVAIGKFSTLNTLVLTLPAIAYVDLFGELLQAGIKFDSSKVSNDIARVQVKNQQLIYQKSSLSPENLVLGFDLLIKEKPVYLDPHKKTLQIEPVKIQTQQDRDRWIRKDPAFHTFAQDDDYPVLLDLEISGNDTLENIEALYLGGTRLDQQFLKIEILEKPEGSDTWRPLSVKDLLFHSFPSSPIVTLAKNDFFHIGKDPIRRFITAKDKERLFLRMSYVPDPRSEIRTQKNLPLSSQIEKLEEHVKQLARDGKVVALPYLSDAHGISYEQTRGILEKYGFVFGEHSEQGEQWILSDYFSLIPGITPGSVIWHHAKFSEIYGKLSDLPEGRHLFVFQEDGASILKLVEGGTHPKRLALIKFIYTESLNQISVEPGTFEESFRLELKDSLAAYSSYQDSAFALWIDQHLIPFAQEKKVRSVRLSRIVLPASDFKRLGFEEQVHPIWIRFLDNSALPEIDASLSESNQEKATMFISHEEIKNRSELRKSTFGLAYEVARDKNTKIVIYGAPNVLEESLKPLREAQVEIIEGGLGEAWKRFGQKEKSRNIHFSFSAERLKQNLGEPILPFLAQKPVDIYAALLFARSNAHLPGIQQQQGLYSVIGEMLHSVLLKHQNDLVIALAA